MCLVSTTAFGQSTEIVYSRGDSAMTVGTGITKAETFDLCQCLDDKALVGMRVKALRITFPLVNGLSDGQAWMSTQLPTIKSMKMQPVDIATKEFTPQRGYHEVVFDEPYTITAEGLYVGYTFKLAEATTARKPVVVTRKSSAGGCYIHSSQKYRTAWHDMAGEWNDLALQVILEGDVVYEHAAGVGRVENLKGHTGEVTTTTAEIINHGTAGVKSFDYTYEIAGMTGSAHVDLPKASQLPGIAGRSATFTVQLPAVERKGSYPIIIEITKVDGIDNPDVARRGEGVANLYNTLPKHRAVLEEYTGTWCGYCPRGYVGLEEMNRLYPEDFIAISYHGSSGSGEPMEFTRNYPSNIAGFPAAFIDRSISTDAFSGNSGSKVFGIDAVWKTACEVVAPAEVDIETEWTEDSVLKATSFITFPVEHADCPYEVSFCLLANGLKGTGRSWAQANYYAGDTGWPSSMDLFTKGGSYVMGLEFNFVIVDRSSVAGIEGSLHAPIEADVSQTYDYSFDLRKVRNMQGDTIIQDKNKLTVVVLLIEKATGKIVNANKVDAGASTLSGIKAVATTAEETVSSVAYYDLQGRRVVMPQHGLFIKAETLANGKVRTSKVLLR